MESKNLKSAGLFAIRMVIAIVALSITAPEWGYSNEADQWASTGLSDSHIKGFLSQKRCYSSERSFIGCIDAVNIILSLDPSKILSNKNIENMTVMGDTIETVQRLKIKKIKNAATPQDQKAMIQSWANVYKMTAKDQLHFEEILGKALSYPTLVPNSQKISFAINQYYETAVDPHTRIIVAEARKQMLNTSESSVVGIGVSITKVNNRIILKPKNGSPAYAAGVMPSDTLLKVDGADVTSKSTDEVTEMIRGAEGTHVNLTISRKGSDLSFDIARANFVEKNIEPLVLNDPINKSQIGYIKLATFSENGICQKFKALAIALHDINAKSLILDLRGNGGGLVTEAQCIASSYLDNGSVIFTENDPDTNRIKAVYKVKNDGASLYNLYGKKPLVILIDSASASASEMVSGSLRAYGRAILIGEKSFGKGTIQIQLDWKEEGVDFSSLSGIAIMKTISRFHFANGESNQLVGLTPDFEVHSQASEKESLREADLYSHTIIAIPHKPYTPGPKILSTKACVAQRNMLASAYSAKINSHVVPNYPMSVAREAASCL